MVQRMAGRADLCLEISCDDHGCGAQRAPGQASWVGLGLGLGLGFELGFELRVWVGVRVRVRDRVRARVRVRSCAPLTPRQCA